MSDKTLEQLKKEMDAAEVAYIVANEAAAAATDDAYDADDAANTAADAYYDKLEEAGVE